MVKGVVKCMVKGVVNGVLTCMLKDVVNGVLKCMVKGVVKVLRATAEQVLDPRTRRVLDKFISGGYLQGVHGCISTHTLSKAPYTLTLYSKCTILTFLFSL